jgi:hypothetical protein
LGALGVLGWFQKLMPREDRYFEMFDRHAACLRAASGTLRQLLEGGSAVPELCAKIMQQEHEADIVTRDVMLAIRRSFITPFDRSDIRGLMVSMDDAIDQMNKTGKSIMLYEVTSFEEPMRELGDTIVQAAGIVAEIVPLLRSMREHAGRLNALAEDVTRIEERSDQLYDQGIKALFLGKGRKDAMAFIVGSEIYGHLEKTVDRLEDVANRVSGIVIEHL